MTLAHQFAAMRLPTRESVDALFEGASVQPEPSAWDDAIDEGRIMMGRRGLLNVGRELFGAPSSKVEAALSAIDDPDRLDRMLGEIAKLTSWQALLAVK